MSSPSIEQSRTSLEARKWNHSDEGLLRETSRSLTLPRCSAKKISRCRCLSCLSGLTTTLTRSSRSKSSTSPCGIDWGCQCIPLVQTSKTPKWRPSPMRLDEVTVGQFKNLRDFYVNFDETSPYT